MSIPADPPLSRRAARQAESSAQDAPPEGFAQPVTRRVRGGTPVSVPSSAPTDVSYRTQVRPRVPHYDAAPPSHTVITAGSQPDHVDSGSPATERTRAFPLVEPPVAPSANPGVEQMRRRDFRPPAEHRTEASADAAAPAGFDTSLDYHTQLSPRAGSSAPLLAESTSAAAPSAPHVLTPLPVVQADSPSAEPPREQTLTRREIRALREQAGMSPELEPAATTVAAVAPVATVPPVAPLSPVAPVAPVVAATALSEPLQTAQVVPTAEPVSTVQVVPTAEPVPTAQVVPAAEPVPLAQPSATPAASSSSAPTGSHWTVGIHDDDDPFENTFSREVGSTASLMNTNALVLPEMPMSSIAGPVPGTGEIIITGMIDLPRTVSSTGTVPTVHQGSDIDDLFDAGDLTAGPADAAPVSALRAISSQTGTHSLMTSSKKSSSNVVTTVLVASTVVMAVVAIGLFVLAAVNGLF